MGKWNQEGQATVEYIFILAFVFFIGFKITNVFTDFFRSSMGNVGHVLSLNVTSGVCAKNCFFNGYVNGSSGP